MSKLASVSECKECNRPANNQYAGCPPRMADGRSFTDYRPRCIANFAVAGGDAFAGANIEGNYDLPNSYEYRQYLVKNGSDIMANNRQQAYQNNACGPCKNPYNDGTMLAEKNMVKCDSSTCSFYQNDAGGIGTGRMYDTDPAAAASSMQSQARFLKIKEQEQKAMAKKENCCWTKSDDMNVFSYDYASTFNERTAVPSGSMPGSLGNRASI